ncbi:hypothetical protein TNIN_92921 [Trichonephila inaurata madagascariensis]|uniref:Uncharacterized protein n=1 Tax=Trichonephila inaurata madagascariensis TaxID=2747483 RepID=A0A8X6Y309_9ARAC|nr:hypothetical protein TNIN_92921 [Trichonephila inaurata madagascariensis]
MFSYRRARLEEMRPLRTAPTVLFKLTESFVRRTVNCRIGQLRAVDHSARGSMKNAASCEIWCELQNTQITDYSNAHCGSFPSGVEPRLSEGRMKLA